MADIFHLLGACQGQVTTELYAVLSALAVGGTDDASPASLMTKEGGFAVLLKNGTGQATVKGSVVSSSTTTDKTFILQANTYDSIGVVYDSGIADGQMAWVVVGGLADVLIEDSHATVRGELVLASATDGRATTVVNPGEGLPATDLHFTEIGHCLESRSAGTNVLARCLIHFN